MARGVNKVILVGNLGQDPEVRYMTSGDAVTNVSLATTKQWRDRESGEDKSKTEWHRLVFFRRLAEIAGEYLKKGSQVYVEGELRTRDWEKEGQKHYTTEIVVNEMQMLGGRGDGGGPPPHDEVPEGHRDNAGGGTAQGSQKDGGSQKGAASGSDSSKGPEDTFDDDIPF